MNSKLIGIGTAWLVLLAPTLAADIDPNRGCKTNPYLVGACYAIRGRIGAYNGTPSMRIWPVGSSRLLGVLSSENEILPDNIRGKVSFEHRVYADLVVCPFTKAQPGVMQLVCVETATNVSFGPSIKERREGSHNDGTGGRND